MFLRTRNAKTRRRIGNLLFFIPVIAVLLLVLFALASYVSSETGTLVVEAESSDRYSAPVPIHAPVTVGSTTGTTPFNLSLPQGQYTVAYGAVSWYRTPPPRSVLLAGGKTEYAIVAYLPLVRVISTTSSGFNSSFITAEHGVTPVVWLNHGTTAAVLQIDTVGRVTVNPSQNYTHVFGSTGSFGFAIFGTSFNGAVQSV